MLHGSYIVIVALAKYINILIFLELCSSET